MNLPEHKCGLYLEHNAHRDYYEKTSEALSSLLEDGLINKEEHDEMLAADSIWSLQWYPETPISFWIVHAPSLETLLEKAAEIRDAKT